MIYFVLSRLQDAVKIGYVEDVEDTIIKLRSRVSAIQTGNFNKLKQLNYNTKISIT